MKLREYCELIKGKDLNYFKTQLSPEEQEEWRKELAKFNKQEQIALSVERNARRHISKGYDPDMIDFYQERGYILDDNDEPLCFM